MRESRVNKSQLNRKKKINKEEMVVPKYMIRFLNPKKFYWDMFVIFLAVWNCITIPIDIAFSSDIFTSAGFILLDICIDLLFLLDIVVNFRTTFYDKDGDEIFDAKIIAKNYALGGRFTIDALATIPFDYMGGSSRPRPNSSLLPMITLSRLLKSCAIPPVN